jgi:Calcineurin-like phosphoesterase/S-layer homology domain
MLAITALLGLVSVAAALPPGGTFTDDDNNIHEGAIEAIAAEGITRGCNPPSNTRFCPNRAVTRGEMAAFLSRTFELSDRAPNPFLDDDGSIFEADIERLAAAGITAGCNPPANDRFCPDDPITRQQMAALLSRGYHLTDAGDGDWFVDDDGSMFEADIDRIRAAGITKGCNPPANTRFCPTGPVTRDQMASFIARAEGLELIVPPPRSVTFTAAGDIGGSDDHAGVVLDAIAGEGADFFLLLGDVSYSQIEPESAWCDWARARFPADHPIEVVAGNHEDDGPNGYVRSFADCVPDQMGATGDYGVEYFFDLGSVRVIMVSADLTVDGVAYQYDEPGPHRDWLLARIDEAEAAGRWTVVGVHKVCVTTGDKGCEIGEAMVDDIIDHGADLILHGHDHNFQRSHQLRCVDVGVTTPGCIVDTDSDFAADEGAVIVVSGWVGRAGYDVSASDPEAGYFATIGGPNVPGWGPGYVTVTATDTTLTATWTTVGGGNSDTFTIRR